jgi:hypothetical protein
MQAGSQSSEFASSTVPTVQVSKKLLWTGRVISAIPVLLMMFSAALKLAKPAGVVQGFVRAGYPESLILSLGILEMLCCVVYMIPRTSILGAILMTGYLGGATATNVRIGDPSYIMTVLLGVFVWGGLYLRDARLRALLPLRS